MSKKKILFIHPVDSYVGKKLRERRLALRISQDQLASYVRLTFQQIQKYEKGLNRISCSKLYDFSRFLKTDIGYFFQGLSEENLNYQGSNVLFDSAEGEYIAEGSVKESAINFSNDIDVLISAFSSIKSNEVRQSVISLVKSLSNRNN